MGSLNTLCKIELRSEFALGLEPVLGQGYSFLYALQPRFKEGEASSQLWQFTIINTEK